MAWVEMTPSNVEPCVRKQYEQILNGQKIVTRYQCPICHELTDNEWSTTRHYLAHAINTRIAQLWKQGKTLKEINDLYHMFDGIINDIESSYDSFCQCHHNITKDNCFTISYLQCCDHPAYKITRITHDGKIQVYGVGGWDGGYSSCVRLGSLRNPRPLSELYVRERHTFG